MRLQEVRQGADAAGVHICRACAYNKLYVNVNCQSNHKSFLLPTPSMPTYTITGIANDRDNERAHGQDERLGVESFYKGNEFFYQYIRTLTSH